MKALMKGNAAAFFAKKQKPQEDIEQVMNQIQIKCISRAIGIDDKQSEDLFTGFFEQIKKLKLPKNYRRYPSTDKIKIIYVNQSTGQQTYDHPLIDEIKVSFYHILTNDKAIYTFNTKSNKLLPFVQEKLMRQCIGLASKRRDAQKANLQRDENGKVVLSKMARLKPDVKGLISSRSYMLKILVQKIYTKKQFWGKGKRANAYASILTSQKNKPLNPQKQEEQQQTEQTLESYEQIFDQSKRYYQANFGQLDFIPNELLKERGYLKSTPESISRNLFFLNIEASNVQLYWLARLMEALPLPPNWSLRISDTFDQFVFDPKKLSFQLHPSYFYILQLMNTFKGKYGSLDIIHQNYYTNMRQMVFFDYFERPYHVDIYGYSSLAEQGNLTRKKVAKKSQQLRQNDWMVMEGIKNSQINIKHYTSIDVFMDYWGSLNYKQETFLPAISPFGQVIWSNSLNQKTANFCPHEDKLRKIVKQNTKNIPEIDPERDFKQFKKTQFSQVVKQNLFERYPEERQNFLKHFIRNDPKPLSPAYKYPEYFEEQQYYNHIFESPFNLESDIVHETNQETGEKIVPLWLQKVHASKFISNYCSFINIHPEKFQDIKEQVKQYTREMLKRHEPNRQEQLMKLFQRELNKNNELKKFIKYINNIDEREQRKRLAQIGVVQQNQDDFLGSSISQIDMDDMMNKSESEEEEQEEYFLDDDEESDKKQPEIDDISSDQQQKPQKQQHQELEVVQQEKQQDQEPERYPGIVLQQREQITNFTEQQLNSKLKAQMKNKMLKHKYSKQLIRQKISSIELNNPQFNTDIKKNLLTSELNSFHAPYKVSPSKIQLANKHREYGEKRKLWTADKVPDISQDYSVFKSEASQYNSEQVDQYIKKYRQAQLLKSQSSQESYVPDYKKIVDDTRETIQLQPLKQIKPDLSKDPVLKNVSSLKNIRDFKKCFAKQQSPKTKLRRNKSTKQIQKIDKQLQRKMNTITTDKNGIKINTYVSEQKDKIKFQNYRLSNISNLSQQKSAQSICNSNNGISPTKFSNFNRVCLGSTASSLLTTQPIMKRGDLLILQAKKDLLHKGRGLASYFSQKY